VNESNERIVPCYCCGTPATKYFTFLPVCDCIPCYVLRQEQVLEVVKKMSSGGSTE
jgi:hypothetical protein